MRVAERITVQVCIASATLALAAGRLSWADGSIPCPYTVTQIAPPNCPFWGPESLRPSGLNNLGEWVGWRQVCDQTNYLAVEWTPQAGLLELPVPPDTTSIAAGGINDQGTIIGARAGLTNGQIHDYWACIWIGGGFVEIPALGGSPAQSSVSAVNNSNVVVGWRNVSDGTGGQALRSGFIWQDGELVNIDPLAFGFTSTEATAVSDSGFVAGVLYGPVTLRAFRISKQALSILEPLPGASYCAAASVDNAGVVVGHSSFPAHSGSSAHTVPTYWQGLEPVALQLLSGYSSGVCLSSNSQGTILGEVSQPNQSGLPTKQQVLWIDGTPHALRPLIDASNADEFGTAYALSGIGQIVGTGYYQPTGGLGAWILNPTAPPSDLNHDCVVDAADLALLLDSWGSREWPAADLNNDGAVDGADLGRLLGAWSAR